MTRLTPALDDRRRMVIVGDSDLAEQLASRLPAERVGNIFEAIGEITIAPDDDPVRLVVIDERIADRAGPDAVEALRRTDPAITIVVLAAGPRQDLTGFDRCLTPPFTGLDDIGQPMTERGSAEPDQEIVSSPEAIDDETTAMEPVEPECEIEILRQSLGGDLDFHRDEDTPLGDVDLVESILAGSDDIVEVALELLRDQTGWTDVSFDPDRSTARGEHEDVVRCGPQVLGVLAARDATRADLEGWGRWLGRWVTLGQQFERYRLLAYQDQLTGAWNRRFFSEFLGRSLSQARQRRRPVTVMVFDIDDFKRYNDEFGHEAGDVILTETVSLLQSVIRRGDRVCRIGGDEFAVIFADPEGPRELGSTHPASVETLARRFRDQIAKMKFPKLGLEAPGRLSISGGLATFPWDGLDAESLLRHADRLAMRSKRKGKNAITFGPGVGKDLDER